LERLDPPGRLDIQARLGLLVLDRPEIRGRPVQLAQLELPAQLVVKEKMEELGEEVRLGHPDPPVQLVQLEHIVDTLDQKDQLVGLVLERLDFKEILAFLDQLDRLDPLEDRVLVEIKEILG
jgi:hypothetical protein